MKEGTLYFDFQITYTCPHCGEENDLEPDSDHDYNPIWIKFKDWICNKKNADKIDIKLKCHLCKNDVLLNEVMR